MAKGMETRSFRALVDAHEAHVWRVALDAGTGAEAALFECLSSDERKRADRLYGPGARVRFMVIRAAVRNILALYVGCGAAEIVLGRAGRGKPTLAGAAGVHFSLSHSAHVGAIAVGPIPVGVDVEHLRQPKRPGRTARRVLHPETAGMLERLPEVQRADAFLDAWTLREAHVKAVGGGLFHTPDALPFDPGMPADGSVHRLYDREGREQWSVARFTPAPGARGALVARGEIARIRMLAWPPDGSPEEREA